MTYMRMNSLKYLQVRNTMHVDTVDGTMKMAHAVSSCEPNLGLQHRLEEEYPNLTTGLRICPSLFVTVAPDKKSFSKLKSIKNYLSNVVQDQIADL